MITTKTESALNCEKHGEYIATISTLVINGRRDTPRTSGCPVCLEEWQADRKREDEERAEKERRYRIAVNRKAATLPSRFAGCTFENYVTGNEGQKRALLFAQAFAKNFAAVRESLIFCGKPGCGKTHLACAIANRLLDLGRTVIYTQAIEMIRAVRETWRDHS